MQAQAQVPDTTRSRAAFPSQVQAAEAALEQRLRDEGVLSDDDLERALRLSRDRLTGEPLWGVIATLGLLPERRLLGHLAELQGLELVEAEALEAADPEELGVSRKFLCENHALVLAGSGERLRVAVSDPFDPYPAAALELATGRSVELCLAPRAELEAVLERLQAGSAATEGAVTAGDYEADAERLRELASEAPVVRLVGQLLQGAAESRASDVHVEPFEGRLRIRYRVDGLLREVDSRPIEMASAVISRIKILASLNIAERRVPQDGRFKTRAAGRNIDLRVSTVPTLHGESVVLRLLNRDDVALDLPALGFEPELAERLLGLLEHPHGILLVTGPTGSGKTTTLYAALRHLNSDERKILTVEDPVEYNLEGINQIQVKPQVGLSFANALRAIVRQDPDIIMVGEMRDRETADIAVQSALTGHLVLSTLHTNDAAGSITRLLDMGVEDYLVTSTVLGILAQRLVRRICEECREPCELPPDLVHRWGLEGLQAWHGAGCRHCEGTGFRGRVSIGELLVLDGALGELVLERADAGRLAAQARAAGMRSLFENGMAKAARGETTVAEVLRVTRDS